MREEGSDGVFELLGLDEPAVAVYRTMLLRPNLTRAEIAQDAQVDVVAVDDILTRLTERKLLRPSQLDPAGLRTESPEVALRRLLSEREADLHRRQERLGETWRAAAGLIEEYRQSRHDLTSEDVERLTTPDTTVTRLTELMAATEQSIDTIVTIPPPARLLELSKSEDAAVLDRGVKFRVLYPSTVRHDPEIMEYLQWYV
ncbi:hypothetical protein PU560_14995, partial [Georgenia sp. 10Sc9-8]|nr:hypothetical protein [Georgenia halotolerans]